MAENTKMEVDGNASETIDEQEAEENMDDDAGEGRDSSDSEESDGNEPVHDPKIQQLELQVLHAFLPLLQCGCAHVDSCQNFIDFSKAFVAFMFYNASFRRDNWVSLFYNCV